MNWEAIIKVKREDDLEPSKLEFSINTLKTHVRSINRIDIKYFTEDLVVFNNYKDATNIKYCQTGLYPETPYDQNYSKKIIINDISSFVTNTTFMEENSCFYINQRFSLWKVMLMYPIQYFRAMTNIIMLFLMAFPVLNMFASFLLKNRDMYPIQGLCSVGSIISRQISIKKKIFDFLTFKTFKRKDKFILNNNSISFISSYKFISIIEWFLMILMFDIERSRFIRIVLNPIAVISKNYMDWSTFVYFFIIWWFVSKNLQIENIYIKYLLVILTPVLVFPLFILFFIYNITLFLKNNNIQNPVYDREYSILWELY